MKKDKTTQHLGTMRAELAMRMARMLAKRWAARLEDVPEAILVTDKLIEDMVPLANECLKQMEWSRRNCQWECGHCGRGEGPKALALAPEEWVAR